MKKYLLLAMLIFSIIPYYALSQSVRYNIHVKDNDLKQKISIIKDKSGHVNVKSDIPELNEILQKYKFSEFTKAYPTAATELLREIYYIECNSEEFGDELIKKFNNEIPYVKKLCDPVPTASYSPNDYYYTNGTQTDLDLINVEEAWDIAKDFPQIPIAINDNGFQLEHEDLNFHNVFGNNDISKYHGTFVAGCLGATMNNSIGIASTGGLNTEISVSMGKGYWGNDSEILQLAQQGYRVINCSWYRDCNFDVVDNLVYNEIRNLWNTVVVFGAGNGTQHCSGGKVYPASYESCLSVTSVGHKNEIGVLEDGIAKNWKDVHEEIVGDPDSTHQHNDAVDICAPGYKVFSTFHPSTYDYSTGTSFAAPQVAGVAAMIIAVNPNLTANQVVDILKSTADTTIYDIPENSNYIGLLGTGRLDAYKAVKQACTINLNNSYLSSIHEFGCFINAMNCFVPSGVNVVFEATKELELLAGFEVELGGIFEAKIKD